MIAMLIQRRMAKRALLSILGMIALVSCVTYQRGLPGEVIDEAHSGARAPSSFPAADEDYFHDMDGGVALSREEIQGRNTWLV